MEKKLILYAEDDSDDRFIFEDSFEPYRSEIKILVFNDGLELINFLKESNNERASLIVLDINMPRLDGKDALRILRELPHYAKIPVVLLTTSSSTVDSLFAKHFNADFITKPMNEMEMQNITRTLLKYCEQPETK